MGISSFFSTLQNVFGSGDSNASSMYNVPASAAPQKPQGGWYNAIEESNTSGAEIEVFDLTGKPLKLGAKDEKGSGGEGTVYELPMNKKFLVKIYKDKTLKEPAKRAELRKRIMEMVQLSNCVKMPFLAWPMMPALNAKGEVIGFVMRKCSGKSFLSLRGARFIQQNFPGWTRRELVKTALNFVKAVRLLVANNVLINDFNPANFIVNEKCEVSFIDCDSFQIPTKDGGCVMSHTHFPSHTAPELLTNKALLDAPRNIQQVTFGTALTVFNLVMCGLHPYAYCDPSHKSACGTPDENLLKGRCPLGKGAGCKLPQGGWYNLWSWLTYRLKDTFIKMFKDGHSNPAARPSLETLQVNLEELLACMTKDPARLELMPATAKSSELFKGTFANGSGTPYKKASDF